MLLDTITKDLKILINSAVIKYNRDAKAYETVESLRESDDFIAASLGYDSFDSYRSFSIEALEAAGLKYPEYNTLEIFENKNLIPRTKRMEVVKQQRKIIIRDYVEKNDYYRALAGLPPYNEKEENFFRVDNETAYLANVDNDKYLHEMDDTEIYRLDAVGYIKDLISKNPDKIYLKYLGMGKVDILKARTAKNFSILKISKSVPQAFYDQFIETYEICREYTMTVLYNNKMDDSYELYDNFMALATMVMTIQRIITTSIKFGISRDFYDWTFIQNLYEMYRIPFIETMPIEYHVTLVKNFNILLQHKSTDRVFFDILSLLGFERMMIYRYYLIRKHKLDENEQPIFIYKQKTDEEGNKYWTEDLDKMFEIYFQKVNIREDNVVLQLEDLSNKLDYNETILEDPYWFEDEDVINKKYECTYNYQETKYVDTTLMYKMTKMLFEITYLFRMILDRKSDTENIMIDLPKIYSDKSFRLFDVVIFLVSLMCKLRGFKDYTITQPYKISNIIHDQIYGFDFTEEAIDAIKKLVEENKKIVDPSILNYVTNLNITSDADIDRLYLQIKDFYDLLVDKMYESQDIREYHLYKSIFETMMVEKINNEMFTVRKKDHVTGKLYDTPAKTYLEYLQFTDPVLATLVETSNESDLNTMVEHVLFKLNEIILSGEFFYLLTDGISPAVSAVVELLKFFKSYTIEFAAFNIIYLFDSKHYNAIKLLGDLHMMYVNMWIDDHETGWQYDDKMDTLSLKLSDIKDHIGINDYNKAHAQIQFIFEDDMDIRDQLVSMTTEMILKHEINQYDNISNISKENFVKDIFNLTEWVTYQLYLYFSNDMKFIEEIKDVITNMDIDENDLNFYDTIYTLCNMKFDNIIDMDESLAQLRSKINAKDILIGLSEINIDTIMKIIDAFLLNHSDSIYTMYTKDMVKDTLKITEKIALWFFTIYYTDIVEFKDNLGMSINISLPKDNIRGQDYILGNKTLYPESEKLYNRESIKLFYED